MKLLNIELKYTEVYLLTIDLKIRQSLGILLILCFFQACGITYLTYGENDKERIGKRNTIYQDYSNLGPKYLPLEGVLLKTNDRIEYIDILKDSLQGESITWHSYRFEVSMKLVRHWRYKGTTARNPGVEKVVFELLVNEDNAMEIYERKKKEYLVNIDKNLNSARLDEGILYGSCQCEKALILMGYPSSPNGNDKLSIFSPEKIIKLSVNNLDDEVDLFLTSFVIYNLTTGIAFLIDGKVCEIAGENIQMYN